jgi:beta-barrel assembly-enhancing protease
MQRLGGVGQTLARFLSGSNRARALSRKIDSEGLVEVGIEGGISLGEHGLSRAQRQHNATSKRMQDIIELIDARFSDGQRPEMSPIPWLPGTAGFNYLGMLDRVQQMLIPQDRQHLLAADRAQQRMLQELKSSPVGQSALGRYVQLRFRPNGVARDEAVAAIEQELQMADSLFIAHALAMDVVSDYGSREKALQLHSMSMESFGDRPEMLVYGVRLNRRAGRSEEVRSYQMRCAATGIDSVRLACQQE